MATAARLLDDKILSTRAAYECKDEKYCGVTDGTHVHDTVEEQDDQRDPQSVYAEENHSPSERRSGATDTSFVGVLKDFFRSTFSDHYQAEVWHVGLRC
jgi:hypothetical protein